MEANWSSAVQDAAATLVFQRTMEVVARPEQDDDASYSYQTPQTQGLCRFVHTQCEKELFTTEYLRYASCVCLCVWGGNAHAQVAHLYVVLLLLAYLFICLCAHFFVCCTCERRSNKASGHKVRPAQALHWATCAFALHLFHKLLIKYLFFSTPLAFLLVLRHPQNLRCFPHCCGGHNPKSFCGSGLVVECFLPKCQIVLGRFEEVAKQKSKPSSTSSNTNTNNNNTNNTPLGDDDSVVAVEVGLEYARKELFDEVKVPDQPFGKWFRGTIIPKAADRACFLVNGNRQSWHYGWQSSRLNCKNLHVFKIYFFNQSERNAAALTCVAELASPSFRISSSRKARKTFRSPVMSPSDGVINSAEGSDPGGKAAAAASRVPSIDELLSKNKREPTSSSERFPSQQRRSLVEPLTLLEQPPKSEGSSATSFLRHNQQYHQHQQHPHHRMGYPMLQRHSIAVSSLHVAAAAAAVAAAAENAHARRERKRLTRSASLKSDYFTNVSFPPLQQQQQQHNQQQLSLSATHPPPQFAYQQQQQMQQQHIHHQQQRVATPTLPSVAYMNGSRMLNARRSSLAALPMPSPAGPMPPVHNTRGMPVTTPIADMMQLRLESPHPQESYHHQYQQQQHQQRSSLSSLTPSALHQHAYSSAKPMAFARREASASWSSNAPPVYFPMIPASSPDGYLNRKRNRSTDSDKGLLAAIQASEALLASARGGIGGGSPMKEEEEEETAAGGVDETDTVDLHRRARVLQLAFTILKRIHRFEEVSKATSNNAAMQQPKVYRHSFEMVIPSSSSSSVHGKPTLVQIPLSNHQILHLCSSLVSVSTSLMQSGLLLDIRQRLVEYAQAGVDLYSAYSQIVDFVDDAVHEQVCQLPKRTLGHRTREAQTNNTDAGEQDEWDLYDLIKNAEAWLLQEPWWCATDEDDDDAGGGDEDGPHSDLPYYNHFADYFGSIQAAIPSQGDLEVAASLRDAALNGVRGLTGEWARQGNHDELNAHTRPKSAVAATSSASGASLSWLSRQIHGHMTQLFHMTETATTMTLALPNSLISSEAVFLFDLDRQEPTVVIPQDCFPFGWARKRLMVAYRAWRVRGIGDENGSAVAVQFMRWPENANADSSDDESEDDDDDDEEADNADEPEEEPLERSSSRNAGAAALLRTRVTIYFSVFLHNRLQVRTIVEGSMAGGGSPSLSSASRQHPTEADMLQYFKSPSSWELMSQVTQEYERKSAIDDDL